MRVEYFINGFHQPELSYYGEQSGMPEIPYQLQKDIQPFQQSYKYFCNKVSCLTSQIPTLVGATKSIVLLVDLSPQDNITKDVFRIQYGENAIGDYSFPEHVFPLSITQVMNYNNREAKKYYKRP